MTIDEYYNKFNEDKRLDTRRGQVEYTITQKYIHDYLKDGDKIIDVGAGTGKYSISLFNEGYDVTAVELVKHNLQVIKNKNASIKAFQGNALDLSKFLDDSFDIVLLFGPMYHLKTEEEQVKALLEAKRIVKKTGFIFVAYCMNDYAIITHGFKDNNILDNISKNEIDDSFHVTPTGNLLYSYVRIEDIDKLNNKCGLDRIKIIGVDGAASYIKEYLNKMDNQTFEAFIKYQEAISERKDLIGASTHTIDILKKD